MSEAIQGRELLDFIEQLGDLDWFKYEARYVNVEFKDGNKIVEDRSARPPYASFRFKVENPEIIEKIRSAIAEYQGEVKWVMEDYHRVSFLNTRNWTICPKEFMDNKQLALNAGISVGQFMERFDPMFGPKAYKDMPAFVAYLSEFFDVPSATPEVS